MTLGLLLAFSSDELNPGRRARRRKGPDFNFRLKRPVEPLRKALAGVFRIGARVANNFFGSMEESSVR